MFANGRIIPKTFKMVLDTALLNNIRYVSRVKWSNPPQHFGVVAIEKGAFWSPLTTVADITFKYNLNKIMTFIYYKFLNII